MRIMRHVFVSIILFSTMGLVHAEEDATPPPSASKYLELLKEVRDEAVEARDYEQAAKYQALIKAEKAEGQAQNSGGKPSEVADPCDNGRSVQSDYTAKQIKQTGEQMAEAVEKGDSQKMRQLNTVFDSLVTDVIPRNIGWGKACERDGKPNPQDNEDFFLGIYAGVEGTSVENLKEETTVRVGVTAYNQLVRFKPNQNKKDTLGGIERRLFAQSCQLDQSVPECGFGFGLHGWLTALLTSSAEQSEVASEQDSMGAPPEEPEVEENFEAELGLFVPVLQKHQTKRGHLLVGPTALTSESKLGDSSSFNKRYYGGLRFAYSPEFYLDLLYGKTEGLSGRRAEFRYQMPVGNLTEDSRLLLGLAVNMGIKDDDSEGDSVRLYLTWNTGINKIFGR